MIKRTHFLSISLLFLLVGSATQSMYSSLVSFRFLRHKENKNKRVLIYGAYKDTDVCLSMDDFLRGIEGLGKAKNTVRCFLEIIPKSRRDEQIEKAPGFSQDETFAGFQRYTDDEKGETHKKRKSIPWLEYLPSDERTQLFSDPIIAFFDNVKKICEQSSCYQSISIKQLLEVIIGASGKHHPALTVKAYKGYLDECYKTLMAWKESLAHVIPCHYLQGCLREFKDASEFICKTILKSTNEDEHLYRALIRFILKETKDGEQSIKDFLFHEPTGIRCFFEERTDFLFASLGFLNHLLNDQLRNDNSFTVAILTDGNAHNVSSLLQSVGYQLDERRSIEPQPFEKGSSYYRNQHIFTGDKDAIKLFQIAFSMAHPSTEADFLAIFQELHKKVILDLLLGVVICKEKKEQKAKEVSSFSKKCSNPLCDTTQTISAAFKVCSKCKKVCYCSQACQKTHWRSSHKAVCT